MDNSKSVLAKRRDAAIAKLEAALSNRPGTSLLTPSELNVANNGVAGWRTTIPVNGQDVPILIIVDKTFPFSLPAIYMSSAGDFLQNPHVEQNGKLCVEPDHVSFSHSRSDDLLNHLINRSIQCLERFSQVATQLDFVEEFQSYWARQSNRKNIDVVSLIDPTGPTRRVSLFNGTTKLVFAEDDSALASWMSKVHPDVTYKPRAAIFLFVQEPLLPSNYPTTNKQFRELVESKTSGGTELLQKSLLQNHSALPALFAFETPNGPALGAVLLEQPIEKTTLSGKQKRRSLTDGFRRDRIPASILCDRFFTNFPLQSMNVTRADHAWLRFRTGDGTNYLEGKKVTIVGCGSIGSAIAYNLARCGLSQLVLIDGDVLSWENVGRHLLGAEFIGKYKANAIKDFLNRQLPHIEAVSCGGLMWQDVYERDKAALFGSDLIISTTGSWKCDNPLNTVIKVAAKAPPLVFGWTEPFGCAGQALVVSGDKGCLSCGTDDLGNFKFRATDWQEPSIRRSGACGQFFQPYNLTEVLPIQDMITKVCVDVLAGTINKSILYTYAGSSEYLQSCGGTWNAEFTKMIELSNDLHVYPREWDISSECALCNA